MERFNNYVGMIIEFLIISIMFLVLLPFRILYRLGSRLASR
jgi:competence protein ComGC